MTSFLGLANQVITFTTDLDYTTLLYKPTSIIIEERLGWQWSHNHRIIIQGNPNRNQIQLAICELKVLSTGETSDKLNKEHQIDSGVLQNLSDISWTGQGDNMRSVHHIIYLREKSWNARIYNWPQNPERNVGQKSTSYKQCSMHKIKKTY